MQFNFFTWLREGVRRSVLLGVSDAVEQIGLPNEGALHPGLLEAGLSDTLRQQAAALPAAKGTIPSAGGRKRLGRSLKDLESGGAAPRPQ